MKQSLPEISLEGVMGWLRENLLLVLTFSGDLMLVLFIFVCLCLLLLSFYDVFCSIVVTVVVLGVVVELLLTLLFILVGTVSCCCCCLVVFLLLFVVCYQTAKSNITKQDSHHQAQV